MHRCPEFHGVFGTLKVAFCQLEALAELEAAQAAGAELPLVTFRKIAKPFSWSKAMSNLGPLRKNTIFVES